MTEQNQVYKCTICGNIVSVMHSGAGELVCCNQSMNLLMAGQEEASTEKHVPLINRQENKINVQIGEIAHPMDDDHYIEWIMLVADNEVKTIF